MATGDNALTGMWVSQKWGILNSDEYFIAELHEDNGESEIIWDNEFRENIIGKRRENSNGNNNAEDEISLDATESRIASSSGNSGYYISYVKYLSFRQSKRATRNEPKFDNKKSSEIFNRFMNE